MKRRIFSSVIMLLMFLSQVAFAEPIYIPPAKWLTCFYVSGADLEREFGLWHNDMLGLEQRVLKPEVKHLLLFGGCKATHADILMRAGFPRHDIMCLQSDGWYSTGYNLNNPPMGEAKTMTDFLNIANNIQADKKCLIIWGHGGGSLIGSPYDEITNDYLDLNELGQALSNVYTPNIDNPPIDLVIYDSCLMSTLENVNVLKGYVKYMVASSELVPFFGFNYSHLNDVMNENPDISAKDLAQAVANQLANSGQNKNTITSTVIDISNIDKVNTAYTAFLQELNANAADNYTANKIRRFAYYADHYGAGNLLAKNPYDMVDLYSLAYELRDFAPNTYENILQAIDEVQPFYMLGANHRYGSTLSVYFPRSGMKENAKAYSKLHVAEAEAVKLANKLLSLNTNITKLNSTSISLKDNILTAKLNKNDINNLIMIESHLYIMDNNSGNFYSIGCDARINADWDTGEISYELPNNWFAIDGHVMPCYTTDIRNDSTIYATPVKVNGEEGYLCFRSDDDNDNVEIIGVTKDLVSANYNQENMYQLKRGDSLTLCIIVPNNTSTATVNDLGTFTINEPPVIENKPLPAGKYQVCLSFVSADQELVESTPVDFSI